MKCNNRLVLQINHTTVLKKEATHDLLRHMHHSEIRIVRVLTADPNPVVIKPLLSVRQSSARCFHSIVSKLNRHRGAI